MRLGRRFTFGHVKNKAITNPHFLQRAVYEVLDHLKLNSGLVDRPSFVEFIVSRTLDKLDQTLTRIQNGVDRIDLRKLVERECPENIVDLLSRTMVAT